MLTTKTWHAEVLKYDKQAPERDSYHAEQHVDVPDVTLRREHRPADCRHLPDVGQGDHADYEQESPEVWDLLGQHFSLS